MKAALPIIALCASFVAAVAVPTAHNTDGLSIRTAEEIEDMPIVDLQVIDERFGDQVFSGTYQSAVAQMKALKPELFADETEDVSVELGLEKRQGAPVSCNWGERIGSWNQCIDGMVSLGRAGDKWCIVQPNACARVSCSYGCGMFLCNKLNAVWRVHCRSIPSDINAIATKCQDVFGRVFGRRDFNTHFIGLGQQSC